MRTMAIILAAALAAPVFAQEPAKPGPEHELLKKQEGTWEAVMKAGGMEYKGTATHKMELGGLWLCSSLDIDMGGQKFSGKGLDTYDAGKKKYVSVWADSMGTSPMLMEGTLDPKTRELTMIGRGPGMDGQVTEWKMVSSMPDANTMKAAMFVGGAKEPMFTLTYKRKK